jgi:hypothetical protein
LGVFVVVLAGLKFFFGRNISIIGSVLFTLIFGVIPPSSIDDGSESRPPSRV